MGALPLTLSYSPSATLTLRPLDTDKFMKGVSHPVDLDVFRMFWEAGCPIALGDANGTPELLDCGPFRRQSGAAQALRWYSPGSNALEYRWEYHLDRVGAKRLDRPGNAQVCVFPLVRNAPSRRVIPPSAFDTVEAESSRLLAPTRKHREKARFARSLHPL
jgi:hypothetical protein